MNLTSGPFSISFYLGINADSVLPRRREQNFPDAAQYEFDYDGGIKG